MKCYIHFPPRRRVDERAYSHQRDDRLLLLVSFDDAFIHYDLRCSTSEGHALLRAFDLKRASF